MSASPVPEIRAVRSSQDVHSARAALAGFAVAASLSVWLRLRWTDGAWFTLDDFNLLSERTAGDMGDLFRSQNGHWCTLPILVYRLLWQLFGLRYLPYQLLAIALYVGVAVLVRTIMRRAGIGPWLSTAGASLVVFLGPNAENNFMTSAMCFGLVHLILVDHDGPPDHRDWFGLVAGFAGLMCSGQAVTMTMVVGIAALLRRGWRISLLHTVPLGAAFLLWTATAAKTQTSPDNAQSAGQVARFVWVGLQEAFGRLGQLAPVGVLLALLLVGGTVLLAAQEGVPALRRRVAAPLSLSAGALIFLTIVGVRRSGQAGILASGDNTGPDHARFYAYAVSVMMVPMLMVVADTLMRRWRQVGIAAAALFAVAAPGYVRQFRSDARTFASIAIDRREILAAPRSPLADQLPPTLRPGGFGFGGPTLGWLIDSLPSGRIPSPGPLTADARATLTARLALRVVPSRSPGPPCPPLLAPTQHVLQRGASVVVRTGSASLVHVPREGGRSSPILVRSGEAVVALAGPISTLITPGSDAGPPAACR